MSECVACNMTGNLQCDVCENWICYDHVHLYNGQKLCRGCMEELVKGHAEDYIHEVELYHPDVDAAVNAAVAAATAAPVEDVIARAIAELEAQSQQNTPQPELTW